MIRVAVMIRYAGKNDICPSILSGAFTAAVGREQNFPAFYSCRPLY
jgi:hypothetical protein